MENKQNNNTVVIIVIIVAVLIIGMLILFFASGLGLFWWFNKKNVSPTPTPVDVTSEATSVYYDEPTEESPSDIVMEYMTYTLGTIPGANINYDVAKDLTSYEIAQQFDNPGFVPQSYCIQDGPSEVSISSEVINDMEASVRVKANYGGDEMDMWEFILVNGESGWKIWSIECLQNGQITK